MTAPAAPRAQPRRGLRRAEAAAYIGVSPSKFDQMIADGRMPGAIPVDGMRIWDVFDLDSHFDALKDRTGLGIGWGDAAE